MEQGDLYNKLVRYVRRKFASRPNISDMSEDIVNDVFLALYAKHGGGSDKENFGYLSVSCIHQAYKRFKAWSGDASRTTSLYDCLSFLSDQDVVSEIVESERTEEVLASLEVLKAIEKSIIIRRYYGDLRFSEIAADLGMNLNTVLSHHRRALEKLRPKLTKYLQYD